jgi:hypothetical protein
MSTVMPQGELLRKALAYALEQRSVNPGKSTASILDEAGMRFNLSPLDTASLERLFAAETSEGKSG